MFDGQRFSVIAVDGCFLDAFDCEGSDAIKFVDLSWEDACTLARLCFDQGFQVVIWRLQQSED